MRFDPPDDRSDVLPSLRAQPDANLEYYNFAKAFNSGLPPKRMGSEAFQPPRPSEIVRKRQPIDADPKALGEVRSLESIPSSLETVQHMNSLSTLPIAPPLDKTPWMAPRTDQQREAERADKPRYDQMAEWRGEGGMGYDTGGLMGKEIMAMGRDIDWTADNQGVKPEMLYAANDKVSSANMMPQSRSMSQTRSMPNLTPLERPAVAAMSAAGSRGSTADNKENATATGGSAGGMHKSESEKKLHWALGDPSELQRTFTVNTNDGKYSTGNFSRSTTRSRLALAHELAGSRSTLECLYPGRASHYHIDDTERCSRTSSIASLRAISGAARPMQDPRIVQEAEWRKIKVRERSERDLERDTVHQAHCQKVDERVAAIAEARRRVKSTIDTRRGQRQLLVLTRDVENGKAPIVLEAPNRPTWGSAPPHLTSHWATITGHFDDPPPREKGGVATVYGRKSFPERDLADDRPGKITWGGAHP